MVLVQKTGPLPSKPSKVHLVLDCSSFVDIHTLQVDGVDSSDKSVVHQGHFCSKTGCTSCALVNLESRRLVSDAKILCSFRAHCHHTYGITRYFRINELIRAIDPWF